MTEEHGMAGETLRARLMEGALETDDAFDDGDLIPRDEHEAAIAAERERVFMEVVDALSRCLWRHLGDDAYSRGMDKGAIEQHKSCLYAVNALRQPEEETQ